MAGLINGQPLKRTETTPEIIIGVNNMDTFLTHYKICQTYSGEKLELELNKACGGNRAKIAEVYNNLRDNGFYPLGINEKGQMTWGVATKSESQLLMEKGLGELQGKNKDELMEISRKGFHSIASIDVNLAPGDLDREINERW